MHLGDIIYRECQPAFLSNSLLHRAAQLMFSRLNHSWSTLRINETTRGADLATRSKQFSKNVFDAASRFGTEKVHTQSRPCRQVSFSISARSVEQIRFACHIKSPSAGILINVPTLGPHLPSAQHPSLLASRQPPLGLRRKRPGERCHTGHPVH